MKHPIFFIPGFQGSGPTHWQTCLRAQLDESATLRGVDWQQPNLSIWVDQARNEVAALCRPALLVAHSFGCLVAATLAAEVPGSIAGIVFVAPANPRRFAAAGGLLTDNKRPDHMPVASVADVLPEALPAAIPSILLASENDPWLSFSDALELKERWRSHFVDLGEVGHVNVDSGFGPWPALAQQLRHWREQRLPDFHSVDRSALLNRPLALSGREPAAFMAAFPTASTLYFAH